MVYVRVVNLKLNYNLYIELSETLPDLDYSRGTIKIFYGGVLYFGRVPSVSFLSLRFYHFLPEYWPNPSFSEHKRSNTVVVRGRYVTSTEEWSRERPKRQ